jgi:hypothetical protein
MSEENMDTVLDCLCCKEGTLHHRRFRNIAVPEYLYIHNNLEAYVVQGVDYQDGVGYKNRNPLGVPEELDITQHMTVGDDPNALPIRYGLRHVMYHSGELGVGHYTAGITRLPQPGGNKKTAPVKEFFCNDEDVQGFTAEAMNYEVDEVNNMLMVVPLDITPEDADYQMPEFDVSAWIYTRLPNRSERPKASPGGGIARRIKTNPRLRIAVVKG